MNICQCNSTRVSPKGDACSKSSGSDAAEINESISLEHANLERSSETEATGSLMSDVSPVNKVEKFPKELAEDDLADSGDDLAPATVLMSSVSRRKLRMVVDDLEDDE